MTLSNALRIATGHLAGSAQQISLLSRNIAGVSNPDYVRRESVISQGVGGMQVVDVERIIDYSVFKAALGSNSGQFYQNSLVNGLDGLSSLIDVNGFSNSPSAWLGQLEEALQLASATPSDSSTLTNLVETARSVSLSINSTYQSVVDMRREADAAIATSVDNINGMLGQLKSINDEVVNGTLLGNDVFDAMDQRDKLLRDLSEEIGIKVRYGENSDVVVQTDNGLLLFESQPREVTFDATPVYGPNTVGNSVRIDGVVVGNSSTFFPITSGNIAAQLELRDQVYVEQANQLDEYARGLIEMFAEFDQTGGGKPALAGMFTWSGGPGLPAMGTIEPGIAASLTINPLVDPSQGGSPQLIRDGGVNGDPDYILNSAGSPGFSDLLSDISSRIDQAMVFDPDTGVPTTGSLRDFAASSLDWLQSKRQSEIGALNYQVALNERFTLTLRSETGPNLDQEMAKLLEVERAYQATSKLIAAADEMFVTLLNSVGR